MKKTTDVWNVSLRLFELKFKSHSKSSNTDILRPKIINSNNGFNFKMAIRRRKL